MKQAMQFIIVGIILLIGLATFTYFYTMSNTENPPMNTSSCFNEANFSKVSAYLEKNGSLQLDDFTIRIFEGSIVFDGKKGELLGSISKEKGVIPVVIYGYEDMRNRMNETFCTLVKKTDH